MGAADSHPEKLDRIQRSAQDLGGFEIENLESRRDAACVKLAFKLLDGKGRGSLNRFAPSLVNVQARSKHQSSGLQLTMPVVASRYPLECFKRSFFYRMPEIWSKIPQSLIMQCEHSDWLKIPNKIKRLNRSKS